MKTTTRILLTALLVMVVVTAPSMAGQKDTTVTGEVIEVQQRAGGKLDEVRVRTRSGEEKTIRLGNGGSCDGCLQVGDQIRARARGRSEGQMAQVREMTVKRNGQKAGYDLQNGNLVRRQSRNQTADGSGTGGQDRMRDRSRQQTPGSGTRASGGGGSRGGGGGGSRRGGG